MAWNLSTKCQRGLEEMVQDLVDRELRQTAELPVVVDLMVRHEVALSGAEQLGAPEAISEFDVAYGAWAAGRRSALAVTVTVPAYAEAVAAGNLPS